MKIHGFFYLVVGTGIAVISRTLDKDNLVLFMYLGIIFAIFGIGKIVAESMKNQKKAISPAPQPVANHFVTRHHRVTRDQRVFIHYCRHCGNQLHPYDNFCSRCGQRIYRD